MSRRSHDVSGLCMSSTLRASRTPALSEKLDSGVDGSNFRAASVTNEAREYHVTVRQSSLGPILLSSCRSYTACIKIALKNDPYIAH